MWKGFVAFSANIWHVRLQMLRSMKRLDTIITLFSSMNQAVYFQLSLSKTKCLIASSACVIFHHCGLTCEFSSAPLMEYFIAFNTNVWLSPTKLPFRWGFAWFPYCIQLFTPFLSTVSHHVTLQMSSTSEGYLTLVLFLPNMNKKVPFQTPSLVESIIALITIIWFFSTLCKKMYLHLVWTAVFFFGAFMTFGLPK